MASFIYFVEGNQTKFTIEDIKAIGLAYAIEGPGVSYHANPKGPSGKAGCLVSGDNVKLLYDPDNQTWRELKPGVWVGLWNEGRPTPADLKPQKAKQAPGELVEGDDGNRWLVPRCLRKFEDIELGLIPVCDLPKLRTLDGEGHWTKSTVRRRYEILWEDFATYLDDVNQAIENAMVEANAGPEDEVQYVLPDSRFKVVESALMANYRVGPVEIDLLGIFTDDFVEEALAVMRHDSFLEELKKN